METGAASSRVGLRDALYAHVQMCDGGYVNLLSPQPEDVTIQRLAVHLSRLPRFNGACKRPLSVAEHSLHACDIAERDLGVRDPSQLLVVLLHDAPEAYLGDDTRPKQQALEWLSPGAAQALHYLHSIWANAVHKAFHVTTAAVTTACIVKQADYIALATERKALLVDQSAEWVCLDGIRPAEWLDIRAADAFGADDWARAFADRVRELQYAMQLRSGEIGRGML